MQRDYSNLLAAIILHYGSRAKFALAMKMSLASLTAKLSNKSSFTQREIESACDLLGIAYDEIPLYFFKYSV